MNKYLLGIAKRITPQPVKDFINGKLKKRDDKRILQSMLTQYNSMCDARVPGFIILDPYVKTDRVFDGIQYYSQVYQDYYLDHYIFHGKENGIFLDVGAMILLRSIILIFLKPIEVGVDWHLNQCPK